MKARLVKNAEDYPWSSARAHLTNTSDGVVVVEPLLELVPDWREWLTQEDATAITAIERSLSSGRPLGDEDFLRKVELKVNRDLQKKKPGPKPKVRI